MSLMNDGDIRGRPIIRPVDDIGDIHRIDE
jgi:hypothetical protein